MKSKYVMINGLAFSEESDMEKLKDYASKGWILEDIKAGFFYKLKKDEPQDIIYNLDYQTEVNGEYFSIFKEAGWKHVVSVSNYIHIFSAQTGTKPIYSDSESEIDKYTSIKSRTGKMTLYSLLIGIALTCLLVFSIITMRSIFLIISGILAIDFCVFVFNFMPYLAYSAKIKQIKRDGKCKTAKINNKNLWKINAFIGLLFLVEGIGGLMEKKYLSILSIIISILYIILSLNYYKKYRKAA